MLVQSSKKLYRHPLEEPIETRRLNKECKANNECGNGVQLDTLNFT